MARLEKFISSETKENWTWWKRSIDRDHVKAVHCLVKCPRVNPADFTSQKTTKPKMSGFTSCNGVVWTARLDNKFRTCLCLYALSEALLSGTCCSHSCLFGNDKLYKQNQFVDDVNNWPPSKAHAGSTYSNMTCCMLFPHFSTTHTFFWPWVKKQ